MCDIACWKKHATALCASVLYVYYIMKNLNILLTSVLPVHVVSSVIILAR